jgi:murein DD-endopeptidase MepM/ murein hydrolase activator NlpD
VYRGQALGKTDNTGNSTGPHLHYQINSPAAGAVDPAPTMR